MVCVVCENRPWDMENWIMSNHLVAKCLFLFALAVWSCSALPSQGEEAKSGAAAAKPEQSAWSAAVNGLQARLMLKRTAVVNGTPIISTYLELRNVANVGNPMLLRGANAKQEFKVIDADGRALPPPASMEFDGKTGGIGGIDLVIPWHGTLSFDISGCGLGIPADKAGLIDLVAPKGFGSSMTRPRLTASRARSRFPKPSPPRITRTGSGTAGSRSPGSRSRSSQSR